MSMERFTWKTLLIVAVVASGCTAAGGTNDGGTTADSGEPVTDAGPTDGGIDAGPGFVDQMNHTFGTAKAVRVDRDVVLAKLPSATSGDYYSFTGAAGDTLLLLAYAQILDDVGNGADRIDTVVTLYDSNHNQIAQDDDAWPRFASDSELFFKVPATGTYFFSVQDCHATSLGNCGSTTSTATNFEYETAVFHVARLNAPEVFAGLTQDGTIAHAATVTYTVPDNAPDAGNGKNDYGRYILDGRFDSTSDVHVFAFTPPADTDVTAGAPVTAEFWVQPIGANNGDGSTSNVQLWVTEGTGIDPIGYVDQSNYGDGDNMTNGALDFSVPVTLGTQYYLHVAHAGSTSTPATDYYFIGHGVGNPSLNTIEVEPNNSVSAPQAITAGGNGVFGVVGTLTSGDEDWFQVDAPTGSTKVSISCSAQRSGSGLRGFTFGLYTASGATATLVAGTEATEVANADLGVSAIALPSGMTHFFLKLTATSQDGEVTGKYYGCGLSYAQ